MRCVCRVLAKEECSDIKRCFSEAETEEAVRRSVLHRRERSGKVIYIVQVRRAAGSVLWEDDDDANEIEL